MCEVKVKKFEKVTKDGDRDWVIRGTGENSMWLGEMREGSGERGREGETYQ